MVQTFIGFENAALAYNRLYDITDDDPGIAVRRNVIVSAMRPTEDGNMLEALRGGVFDADGTLVAECLQPRSDGRNAIMPGQERVVPPATTRTLPKAVFGGVAFDHFGHFLLETTTRLWALPGLGDLPWVFATAGSPRLPDYQRDFLAVLGLPNDRCVVADDWLAVDELVIPGPAFAYHHWASRAFLRPFRRGLGEAQLRTCGRTFLSRSDTTIALTVGEAELEDVLRADGWNIVVPERLPAAEQAALFRGGDVVMGLQGSAMHLGLFGPPGAVTVHLCRGQAYRGYYLLDDLTQADATYLHAMTTHALRPKPITGPFRLDLDTTLAFLRDRGLLSRSSVAVAPPSARDRQRLDEDYVAWWWFTESQIRFHRRIGDDGSPVDPRSALDAALEALAVRPQNARILCHALALTIKFEGYEAAAALLATHHKDCWSRDAPDDAQLLHFVSMIADHRGEREMALGAARRCAALAPGHATYVNQFATALYRLDRLDEAASALRTLVDAGRAIAETLFLMSLVLLGSGDTDGAADWAARAARDDRRNAAYAVHAANLLFARGRGAEALRCCLDALDRSPDEVALLRLAADILSVEERLKEAIALLQRAVRQNPEDEELRTSCRALLVRDGSLPDFAHLRAQTTTAEREQAVMIYKHSLQLLESRSFDAAVRTGMGALELAPDNATIVQHVLGTMIAADRIDAANLLARSLIETGRGTAGTYYVVSLTESAMGHADLARAAARHAVVLEPDNTLIRDHHDRLAGPPAPEIVSA